MTTKRNLLFTEDVFQMTGYHPEVIRRAMRDGKLRASNKSGRWVTTRQAVADWIGCDVADVWTLYSPRNTIDTDPELVA